MANILELAKKHLYPNYVPAPVAFREGRGVRLVDTQGKTYLDLGAGVAVCSLGHAHPDLVAALTAQAGRLTHVSNYYYNEENVLLAAELCEKTGYDRAFFCNSGAEANEGMLKLARRHFFHRGEAERLRIVAFEGSFHGRTLGALSMTHSPKYRAGFGPPPGPVTHVPFGDVAAVRDAMGNGSDVAAIIVEPVQGEGGVVAAPNGFLRSLREIADQTGCLLMVDEVQTGIGRLGEWLGHSHECSADVVALAKGLGGGVPIGAVLTKEKFAGALEPGSHGSTFGGNPLASAAARTVLRVIERDDLLGHVRSLGAWFHGELTGLADKHRGIVEEVRGRGLLLGLALRAPLLARPLLPRFLDRGVLVLAAGERVLRFAPPLTISRDELLEGVETLSKVLAELERETMAHTAEVR